LNPEILTEESAGENTVHRQKIITQKDFIGENKKNINLCFQV
jgi:hypothetical protein